jgi:hypothetical protein
MSRTGGLGVELMLVALQVSGGEALIVTILIIALLIWAFSWLDTGRAIGVMLGAASPEA